MPSRRPASPAPLSDTWEGRVLQSLRKENHVSLAVDLVPEAVRALGLVHGARLRARVGDHEADVFFHGPMKAWSMYKRFLGEAAHAALTATGDLDGYLESERTMGGTSVPDASDWLRLRLPIGRPGAGPALLQSPEGSTVTLTVLSRPAPVKVTNARLREGALQATVLASHPGALTLALDFPALRKLGGGADDWYTLEVGGQVLSVHQRRGILPGEYEAFFARPEALLFDFMAHWADEGRTVMLLTPMQCNWPGRYPDFASATLPVVVDAGAPAVLRPASA
jgi:hypothetical protein